MHRIGFFGLDPVHPVHPVQFPWFPLLPLSFPAMQEIVAEHSPAIPLDPARVPACPRVFDEARMSPGGYVTSIQATRYAGFFREGEPPASDEQLTRFSELLNLRYPGEVPALSAALGIPGVGSECLPDGTARMKAGPLTLIEMGPPREVAPGVTQRAVRHGLLIAKEDEHRGLFEVRVSQHGKDLLCAIAIRDYRSRVRGTRERDPLRRLVYEKTQMAVHMAVGKGFLRGTRTIFGG